MLRSETRSTVLAAALLVLLVLLATFQYKWLGQIADAERHELQARVDDAAHRIAGDFDRELQRAFVQFLVDPRAGGTAADSLPLKARVWRASAQHSELIADFFLFTTETGLVRLDEETAELRPVDWPGELRGLAAAFDAAEGQRHPPRELAQANALVVPMRPTRPDLRDWGVTILQLDRDFLVAELIPELIATHLGDERGETSKSLWWS